MPSVGKVTLTLSWGFNKPIFKHYQDHGQMARVETHYMQYMQKYADKWSFLHHDNVQTHMEAETIEIIQKLKFEFLPHPAYSTDLTPDDHHIFRLLRDALRGCQFANNEEVKDVICASTCN